MAVAPDLSWVNPFVWATGTVLGLLLGRGRASRRARRALQSHSIIARRRPRPST